MNIVTTVKWKISAPPPRKIDGNQTFRHVENLFIQGFFYLFIQGLFLLYNQ